jgi:hypothetical protein
MNALLLAAVAGAAAAAKTDIVQSKSVEATFVPAHYPYASVEDFFTNSPSIQKNLMETASTKCAASSANEKVYDISDGKQDRCFVAYTPSGVKGPMPIMFFAHGSGGNAQRCGDMPDEDEQKTWQQIADAGKFALVCGEALQYSTVNDVTGQPLQGGLWEIPEVFTNSTGQKCEDADSFDNTYMDNVIAALAKESDTFDTTKFFIHGCSMGSAFTVWQGPCLHSKNPDSVSAFATHSTGYKIKGDGLQFPPDTYNQQYTWGECPDCEYWPTAVALAPGKLKACVFDNTEDPQPQDPLFYKSSEQFVKYWNAAGNRAAEASYSSGRHCEMHSFQKIAQCMDDGTGRLINAGRK